MIRLARRARRAAVGGFALSLAWLAGAAGTAGAAGAADETTGQSLFAARCGTCHAAGPGHAGTMRLAEARGPALSVIEQRTDLTPAYIRTVVRRGLIEMPPWRQTELSDAELASIVQYLTRPRP